MGKGGGFGSEGGKFFTGNFVRVLVQGSLEKGGGA